MTTPWPDYSSLVPETLQEKILEAIESHRSTVKSVIQEEIPSYSGIRKLEESKRDLEIQFSPLRHLNSTLGGVWREPFGKCKAKLSELNNFIGQSRELFSYVQAVPRQGLDVAQNKVLDLFLDDFKISGVTLTDEEQRAAFATLKSRLSELGTQFEENAYDVLDQYVIFGSCAGLSEAMTKAARTKSVEMREKLGIDSHEEGCFGLDTSTAVAVMTHSSDRTLRKRMYQTFMNRASDIVPEGGYFLSGEKRFDNTAILEEMLEKRTQLASLLGYSSYFERGMIDKMAESPFQIEKFLTDLVEKAKPFALRDLEVLKQKATQLGFELEEWDKRYVEEIIRKETFFIDDESVRSHFTLERCLQGLSLLTQKLFRVEILVEKNTMENLWHPDAQVLVVKDIDSKEIKGYCLADFYQRPGKMGGCWMSVHRSRLNEEIHKVDSPPEIPITYLLTNFSPGRGLAHGDVISLFHEMGHTLHEMLSTVSEISVCGIEGVQFDAVEVPSQMLESFAAYHIPTLLSISPDMTETFASSLVQAKKFSAALFIPRQVEMALFDLKIHTGVPWRTALEASRRQCSVFDYHDYHYSHSFAHLFASGTGGYSAGYYSYLWAEVLALDLYQHCLEHGGKDYLEKYLSQGGSISALTLFKNVTQRNPDPSILLKAKGLV